MKYYELQQSDVGRATIHAFGKSWRVADFLGRVLPQDIGKRVFKVGDDILQVENDEQRAARLDRFKHVRDAADRRDAADIQRRMDRDNDGWAQ